MIKQEIEQHWTRTSTAYNRWVLNNMESPPVKRLWLDLFQRHLASAPLEVLDVGTGPGVMAFFLAQLGHRVTALDLSPGMIEAARENAAALSLPVDFQVGDAEALPFPDASFDAVTNRLILWTMSRPEQAVREWARVLKPGGKLIIIDGRAVQVRRTWTHKIWKVATVPLVMVTENRNPLKGRQSMDVWKRLPLFDQPRPDWELNELQRLGFRNVQVERISRRQLGLLEYLKHGCWGDYFVTSGVKPG